MTRDPSLFTYLCMIYARLWDVTFLLISMSYLMCVRKKKFTWQKCHKTNANRQTATGGKSCIRSSCRSYRTCCFTNRLNLLHQRTDISSPKCLKLQQCDLNPDWECHVLATCLKQMWFFPLFKDPPTFHADTSESATFIKTRSIV